MLRRLAESREKIGLPVALYERGVPPARLASLKRFEPQGARLRAGPCRALRLFAQRDQPYTREEYARVTVHCADVTTDVLPRIGFITKNGPCAESELPPLRFGVAVMSDCPYGTTLHEYGAGLGGVAGGLGVGDLTVSGSDVEALLNKLPMRTGEWHTVRLRSVALGADVAPQRVVCRVRRATAGSGARGASSAGFAAQHRARGVGLGHHQLVVPIYRRQVPALHARGPVAAAAALRRGGGAGAHGGAAGLGARDAAA